MMKREVTFERIRNNKWNINRAYVFISLKNIDDCSSGTGWLKITDFGKKGIHGQVI